MHLPVALVHLLNGWSRGSSTRWRSSTTRESARHPTRHPSGALVQLGDDGVAHLLQLLLLVLKLLLLGRLERTKAQYLPLSLSGYSPKVTWCYPDYVFEESRLIFSLALALLRWTLTGLDTRVFLLGLVPNKTNQPPRLGTPSNHS